MTAEEWRPAAGWPDYLVSDRGRVASLKTGAPRLMIGWLNAGYRFITLSGNDARQSRAVHTLVMETFVGPRPDGFETRHLDGDSLNNHLSNMCYGTHSANMRDRLAHGRHPMANKTHCKRDHEFTADNTRYYRGRRFCRACDRGRRSERALRAAGISHAA